LKCLMLGPETDEIFEIFSNFKMATIVYGLYI
jgi:hypothetical protein